MALAIPFPLRIRKSHIKIEIILFARIKYDIISTE